MNLNQGALANGLVEELLDLIHKYDETMYMATAIGCLELVKLQLLQDSLNMDDD